MSGVPVSINLPAQGAAISGVLDMPKKASAILAFAHGASTGINHEFMVSMSKNLSERGLATLRYRFPYMERGETAPDSEHVLIETILAAKSAAKNMAPGTPLFIGGKSLGGRMSSLAQARHPCADVAGIIFYGFPLHPVGSEKLNRADHLSELGQLPLFFLQGELDSFTEPPILMRIGRRIGGQAKMHFVEGADHGFNVSADHALGRHKVLEDLAERSVKWCHKVIAGRS